MPDALLGPSSCQFVSAVYFGMNTLQAELRRLYRFEDANRQEPNAEEPGLITPDGRVRAMVLELARPADWNALSAVWQGVQVDLELPAPAIAVSGIDGYQLWFSLAEPVTTAQAATFLEALRLRYLSALPTERIGMMPCANQHARSVPALQPDTGRWSAFVAPDLAALFADSPWLDVCPSPEAQANVLSRFACIKPAVFQAAMERLKPTVKTATKHRASVTDTGLDPKLFLLGVMNDPAIAMPLRIDAAKALLPYC
jgi:hypothetical protein